MKYTIGLLAACAIASASSTGFAQDQPSPDKYVSKEDYAKLKEDHDKLKLELDALKSQLQELIKKPTVSADSEAVKAQIQELQKKEAARQTETDQALDDLEKQMKATRQMAKDSFPGTTKMLIGGYGSMTFTANSSGYGPAQPLPPDDRSGHNFFTAMLNPLFLWKLNDRLLFEGELEFELEGTSASAALEMAQMSYLANDYMTLGAGKFLNPMDYFVERQHMAWVNKLPDKPLAVYDGLLPESLLGFQVRGAIPAGPTKFGYAAYVANAPAMNVDTNDMGLGTFEFDNFDNVGNHVALGGRLGIYPLPELEIGYGFQYAGVGPSGSDVNAYFHSVDASYVRELAWLKGILNVHAQWVWSLVSRPSASELPGLQFPNDRDGGYVQVAYRPTKVAVPFLTNLEPVLRYDVMDQRKTPVGFDEHRWSVGLDYWLTPSTVAKIAYEWDRQNGLGQNGRAFMLQFALGF